MEKLNFSIKINAPREKVWKVMLEDKTYREWTKAFHEGSYYEGSWEKGSDIRFLGPGEDGKMSGMISRIADNRPYEYISIEHLGIIENGVEDTTSEKVKSWVPAFENYTFKDDGEGTLLLIDMDSNSEYKDMFNELWPRALKKLKEIAERE